MKKRDPLVVSIPDVLGQMEEAAKTDPDVYGKNAVKLKAAIERAHLREEHEEAEWLPLLDKRDADLRTMNYGQLEAECAKLRAGIRAHRDAQGHNLCWYVPELWGLLPEKVAPNPKPPPEGEFLASCRMYRQSLTEIKVKK